MRLFLANEHRFFGMICALVPNLTDAEDVLQETSTAMWRKFDQFEEGTDFAAWGLKFARLQSLKFHEKTRHNPLRFRDELLEQLADEAWQAAAESDFRRDALQECLCRLTDRNRELLRMRYEENQTVPAIAERIGKSIHAVYKAVSRIHDSLLDCVRRKMASGGVA